MLCTAAAGAQSVVVDGQPLSLTPGPIERAGRIFVPLRGIFERLGATVVYASGTINATKNSTTISLHIGSTQATVNGQAQLLDVAPFIVGATTYVPLRFVSQSLGASVDWNAQSQVVAIGTNGGGPVPPPRPPRPPRPPNPPPPPPPARFELRSQQPEPGASIGNRFTVISARFSREAVPGSVRVWLDGGNITRQCGVSATSFSYSPPAPLDFGSHTVRVAGSTGGGASFDRSWSFSVIRSGPRMDLTIDRPGPDDVVSSNFTVAGNTLAGARVRVTAGATPQFNGLFDTTTTAGGRGNFKVNVSLRRLMGQRSVTVRVTATDPRTSAEKTQTLQLRLAP